MKRTRRTRRPSHRPDATLSGIFAAGEQVFRFYPDGIVLDVLVRPAPLPETGEVIARWLRREQAVNGVYAARYSQQGTQISFTTRGHHKDERITVTGTWGNDRLTLTLVGNGWKTGPQRFTRLATAPAR